MAPRRRQPLAAVLGPLEAEVMEAVWEAGDVTVRDVQERLESSRRVAYTTVMTTMSRLADKGLLRRVEAHPAHVYSAVVTKEQYARTTVASVLDWLVGQFQEPAVAYFVDRLEEQDERLLESLRSAIARRESGEQAPDETAHKE